MTWAEDRATVGIDPSADPGTKTEGRATLGMLGSPALPLLFGIGTKAINPSGQSPELWNRKERQNPGRRSPG